MTASGAGKIRIAYADAAETVLIPVVEFRTEALNCQGASNPSIRDMQYINPDARFTWKRDDKIKILMIGDAATNVNNTSAIRVPITRKNVNTGAKNDTDLVTADFGLTAGNVAIGTTWTPVGQYIVNGQEEIRIGKQNINNSQVYMNLNYT